MFKLSQMRAENIETVRERVKAIIKGKNLVGYNLPQKIAYLELLNGIGEKPKVEMKDEVETKPMVPNPLEANE